jgi:hypothetical protein
MYRYIQAAWLGDGVLNAPLVDIGASRTLQAEMAQTKNKDELVNSPSSHLYRNRALACASADHRLQPQDPSLRSASTNTCEVNFDKTNQPLLHKHFACSSVYVL